MKVFSSCLTVALLATFAFSGCKKNSSSSNAYTCATCNKNPEAAAANDASTKGIYKGIIVGSSGTIKFDIANSGNTITAVMVIDGITVNLTSNVTWNAGQAYVAPFTGTLNGQAVTINFSVGLSGATPTITSTTIPGHPNAVISLSKETSTALIECFEGTYNTSQSKTGTFNILISRKLGLWGGVARENGSTASDSIKGTIDANGNMKDDKGNTVGTLSSDQIGGTFKDTNNTTVTVSGKRTL